MKNILLIFLFLVELSVQYTLYGQVAPSIQWQKSLGGSGLNWATSVIQTFDGGYIVVGYSDSNDDDVSGSHGNRDYWVIKLDKSGNLTWQKSLCGSESEGANSVQQTTDGGYIICGYSESHDGDVSRNNGYTDYWLVKLNSIGNLIWQKSYGGSGREMAESIQLTADHGFIIAGFSTSNDGDVSGNHLDSTNQTTADEWIIKLDSVGNIVWQKCYGGSESDDAYFVQQTTDGGFIVIGNSRSNNGDVAGWHRGYYSSGGPTGDCWVTKLSPEGNLLWQKCLGGSGEKICDQFDKLLTTGS